MSGEDDYLSDEDGYNYIVGYVDGNSVGLDKRFNDLEKARKFARGLENADGVKRHSISIRTRKEWEG